MKARGDAVHIVAPQLVQAKPTRPSGQLHR